MADYLVRDGSEQSLDWMQELESDSHQFIAVMSRIDELASQAAHDLQRNDKVAAGIRLTEIREGIRLLCKLGGFKLQG